jgi:hypothetical protein
VKNYTQLKIQEYSSKGLYPLRKWRPVRGRVCVCEFHYYASAHVSSLLDIPKMYTHFSVLFPPPPTCATFDFPTEVYDLLSVAGFD